jgi:hypothetical protein
MPPSFCLRHGGESGGVGSPLPGMSWAHKFTSGAEIIKRHDHSLSIELEYVKLRSGEEILLQKHEILGKYLSTNTTQSL